MVASIYVNNETGETVKLDIGKLDIGQTHKHKDIVKPNWRRDSRTEDTDPQRIHMLLASNPNTPVSTLDSLANQDSPVLLERIAENPNTSPYTLSKLAFHDNPRVRAAVAENPSLPESITGRLANDIHPDVRLRLAENYLLPGPILQVLAEDDNPYVQMRAKKTIDRLNQPMTVSLSFGCC